MATLAEKTVSFFVAYGAIDEDDRDIYEYGAMVVISFVVNAVVTL